MRTNPILCISFLDWRKKGACLKETDLFLFFIDFSIVVSLVLPLIEILNYNKIMGTNRILWEVFSDESHMYVLFVSSAEVLCCFS